MPTQALSHTPTEPPPTKPPDADVIEDARVRQKRHRRTGACTLFVVASSAVILSLNAGGGGGSPHGRPGVTKADGALVQGAALRLARGSSTARFTITAPSAHAYDVTMAAPAASGLVLTMKLSAESSWVLNLPRDQSCTTVAGQARCTLHFSEGGNPGGKWIGIIHKTALSAERVHVSVVFSPHSGDFGD